MNQIETDFKKFASGTFQEIVKYLVISIIPLYLLKELISKILTYEIKVWMALFSFFALYFVSKIYISQKSKIKHNFVKYGLKWVANIKNKKVLEMQGPFCMKCGYQLSDVDISQNNKCPKCSKKYHTIGETIEDLRKKVSNIVEADLHAGEILNIDWYAFFYPNSPLSISNNGSFIVNNIDVEINIDVNGTQHHVGTYSIDNISPDEIKRVDDSNPMVKVNEILNKLGLIKTELDLIDDYREDDRGNVIFFDQEVEWTELVAEDFSSKLNISLTYSLRDERKSTKAKYLLKFKYRDNEPEWPYYVDNCTISLTEIE